MSTNEAPKPAPVAVPEGGWRDGDAVVFLAFGNAQTFDRVDGAWVDRSGLYDDMDDTLVGKLETLHVHAPREDARPEPECRHGEPEARCASCASCAACDGGCGVCPYAARSEPVLDAPTPPREPAPEVEQALAKLRAVDPDHLLAWLNAATALAAAGRSPSDALLIARAFASGPPIEPASLDAMADAVVKANADPEPVVAPLPSEAVEWAQQLRDSVEKCCQCTDGHHDQIGYIFGTEQDVHVPRDIARPLADLLDRLAPEDDEDTVRVPRTEGDIRADERLRIMSDVGYWSERLGVPLVEVPAIVALLVDTSPAGPSDMEWAQHVALLITNGHAT